MSDSEKTDSATRPADAPSPASDGDKTLCPSRSLNLLMLAFENLFIEYVQDDPLHLHMKLDVTVENPAAEQPATIHFTPVWFDAVERGDELPESVKSLEGFLASLQEAADEVEGIEFAGRAIEFDNLTALLDVINCYVDDHNIMTWDMLEAMCGVEAPEEEDAIEPDEREEDEPEMQTDDGSDLATMTPANPAEIFYHLARQGAESSRMEDRTLHPFILCELPGRPYSGQSDIDAMAAKMMKLFNGSASARTAPIDLERMDASIADETNEPELQVFPYYRLH